MKENLGRDELSVERTLLSTQRTFSAWIRTGLAALGVGLAVARALIFNNYTHQVIANVIGELLVILAAIIFAYAIISCHRACTRLSQEGFLKNLLGAMILMTVILLIIPTLVFWITIK